LTAEKIYIESEVVPSGDETSSTPTRLLLVSMNLRKIPAVLCRASISLGKSLVIGILIASFLLPPSARGDVTIFLFLDPGRVDHTLSLQAGSGEIISGSSINAPRLVEQNGASFSYTDFWDFTSNNSSGQWTISDWTTGESAQASVVDER
jgi:hypothetical protein